MKDLKPLPDICGGCSIKGSKALPDIGGGRSIKASKALPDICGERSIKGSKALPNICGGFAIKASKPLPNICGNLTMQGLGLLLGLVLCVFCFIGGQVAAAGRYNPLPAQIYQQAVDAYRMRRFNIAEKCLREIIKKYPDDVYAHISKRELANILKGTKRYNEALELLDELQKSNASFQNKNAVRLNMLDIYYETNRFKDGIEHIEAWLKESRGNIELKRQLAKFYLQTGQKDEAWLLLQTMVEQRLSQSAFNDLLALAVKSGELERLLNTIEARRTHYPQSVYAAFVSDCYIALNQKDKAIEAIKGVNNLNNELELLKKLADLQISATKTKDACETLNKILKITPNEWSALRLLGACLLELNQKSEAISVWKRPITSGRGSMREHYINFSSVLIENHLYNEALKAFYEARALLHNNSMFAEEAAGVLNALGRQKEALKEYLNVLAAGSFKLEVFEKLYEAYKGGYELKNELLELKKQNQHSFAINRALLELELRQKNLEQINQICSLCLDVQPGFDNIIIQYLNAQGLNVFDKFHLELAIALANSRRGSGFELNLAFILLKMGEENEEWANRIYKQVLSIANSSDVADASLKANLCYALAKYSCFILKNANEAEGLIDKLLQSDYIRLCTEAAIKASFLKARILACKEDYGKALELIEGAESLINESADNIFYPDSISISDNLARRLLEKARVNAYKADYQRALDILKEITENYNETIWLNDALKMALFITRRSVGGFNLLNQAYKAEKLYLLNKNKEAKEALEAAINSCASGTALLDEMKADLILISDKLNGNEAQIKAINEFAHSNPRHFKTADLLEYKLKLLNRIKAPKSEVLSLLQTFVEGFANDLRCVKFKTLIKNINSGETK